MRRFAQTRHSSEPVEPANLISMNDTFQGLMREATRLTQSGRLTEATALIQRAMKQAPAASSQVVEAVVASTSYASRPANEGEVLDGCVFEVEEVAPDVESTPAPTPTPTPTPAPAPADPLAAAAGLGGQASTPSDTFASGQFVRDSQSHHYKLYTPPQQATDALLPLVVMLHGCTQNPDDFAVGTSMNGLARGTADSPAFYVLYPSQARAANAQGCWNWFERSHQRRGQGEPAWIAELTQQLVRTLPIDKRRVYVAGLSAGGAMAAIVAAAYPDVFAAVGVHSGLPVGAARNLTEALTAMKHGASPTSDSTPTSQRRVPTIVFQGDQDRTVHARNAQSLIHAATANLPMEVTAHTGASTSGRRHTQTVHERVPKREDDREDEREGTSHAELWQLHGVGHAWSGGHQAGSYTDPKGVNASLEMLRFFLQHQLAE